MKGPTVRAILEGAFVGAAYVDGLKVAGIDVDQETQYVNAIKGGTFYAPPEYVAKLQVAGTLARQGQKIPAIKALREAFGLGLKEAKDIVDAFIPPGYCVVKGNHLDFPQDYPVKAPTYL